MRPGGPGGEPACTPRLLEILAKYDVRATFFLVGRFADDEPILTRYIANAGHLIGNHSWSHPNLALAGEERVRTELKRTSVRLEQITGKPVEYFRPPFGARRPAVLRIARELGLTPVLWNAMTRDWAKRTPEQIADRIAAKVEAAHRHGRAANVVLHDGGHRALGTDRAASVRAAEMLLEKYTATSTGDNSFRRFVTIDSWK